MRTLVKAYLALQRAMMFLAVLAAACTKKGRYSLPAF